MEYISTKELELVKKYGILKVNMDKKKRRRKKKTPLNLLKEALKFPKIIVTEGYAKSRGIKNTQQGHVTINGKTALVHIVDNRGKILNNHSFLKDLLMRSKV
ncbi:hypothetical protein ACFLZZ_01200 [Nanoarchaeota archaeon]